MMNTMSEEPAESPTRFEPSLLVKIATALSTHWRKILNGIIFILIILTTLYTYWQPYPTGREIYDRGHNGLWAGNQWVTGNTVCRSDTDCIQVTEEEQRKFIERLNRGGIQYLALDAGAIYHDGGVSSTPGEFFARLKSELPEKIILLAWLTSFSFDEQTENPQWQRGLISSIRSLQADGFDGVHFYFEDLSNRKGYLELLRALRRAFGKDLFISQTMALPITLPFMTEEMQEYFFDMSFYHQSMTYADQTVLQAFMTALPLEKAYIASVSRSTGFMLDLARKHPEHRILIGVPATGYGKFKRTFQWAENLRNALFGVQAQLETYQEVPSAFEGISLYTAYTASPLDWEIFEKEWRGSSR